MFSDKITLLNRTVLECLGETDEVKIVRAFTVVGLKVLGADFGFVWLNSLHSNKLELVYKSPNLPYTPLAPRAKGRNYKVLDSSTPDFVENVVRRSDKYDVSEHMRSFVIIPLAYKKNVFGTMVMCFKEKESFPKEKKILSTFIGNNVAQAITINRLFTSEHEARVLSKQNEAYFRALIKNSNEIIMLVSDKAKILHISPSVKRICGYEPHEMMGKQIQEFLCEESPKKLSDYLERILKKPNQDHTAEFETKHKNGSKQVVESTALNLLHNPNVKGIVVNVRDITERKKVESLKETELLLNEERLKTEFIENASHEFRTPLAIMRGNVDLMLRKGLKVPKQVEVAFKAVNREVDHLSSMISDLTLLVGEKGKLKNIIAKETVSIPKLIENVVKRHQVIASKKNILIKRNKSKEALVIGDESYLEKLFSNLIRNAINYGKKGGRISIDILKKKNIVEIKVGDNGIGISEEDLKHIFKRFYRADKSRNSHENTGLGLTISKWIVESHNGTIDVISTLGKGTVFVVSLPLKDA